MCVIVNITTFTLFCKVYYYKYYLATYHRFVCIVGTNGGTVDTWSCFLQPSMHQICDILLLPYYLKMTYNLQIDQNLENPSEKSLSENSLILIYMCNERIWNVKVMSKTNKQTNKQTGYNNYRHRQFPLQSWHSCWSVWSEVKEAIIWSGSWCSLSVMLKVDMFIIIWTGLKHSY